MKATNAVLIAAAVVALMIPLAMWQGYVLSILWGWFVVPFGLPPVGVAHAMGLGLIVGALKGIQQEPPEEGAWKRLLTWLVGTALTLGMGAIVKGYL